jgi:hypothetical protein
MAQQTAVEWLIETLSNKHIGFEMYVNSNKEIIEQAKAMEIECLEDCWIAAEQSEDSQTFFNYYNETYNK